MIKKHFIERNVGVIVIDRRFDTWNAEEAFNLCMEFLENRMQKIVFNLMETEVISSSGIGILARLAREIKEKQLTTTVWVACDKKSVHIALDETRVIELINYRTTYEECMQPSSLFY